jgi:hypothetical protein
MNEFFGANLLPAAGDLTILVSRIVLNLLFTTIVVRVVYFRLYQHHDYIFGNVDLLRDTAEIAVYYPLPGRRSTSQPHGTS